MNNKEKTATSKLIIIVFGVLGAIGGKYGYQYFFGNGKLDIQSSLIATANELNKTLPIMVDSETRLDTSTGFNEMFQYNYTLVNYSFEELDPEEIEETLKPNLINSVCTIEDMAFFIKNDVPVSYAYYGKNGKHVLTITVTSDQCES